jgi:galactose mutarotase-like enzyme
VPGRVVETRFRGEPALSLRTGDLTAVFLPHVGMTGVSLRCRGREYLHLPGGLTTLRAGHTAGLPLLAPWANRLGARRYRVGRTAVDLRGRRVPTDDRGLPIHGLLLGAPGWHVDGMSGGLDHARVDASRTIDSAAFPFPHRLDLRVVARHSALDVVTRIVAIGRRRVPVSFGWHPYLRLPGAARTHWTLALPAREQLLLDDRGLPTGATRRAPAEAAPIARRALDNLYALGRDRRLAITDGRGRSVELRCGTGYEFAQVWVPPGRRFVALEPMTAPTNALVDGAARLVGPGEDFTARFTLTLR